MIDPPSTNGRAYRAFLEDTLGLLDGRRAIGYYQESLPAALDHRLANIVGAYSALSPDDRENFAEALSADRRGLFAIFGHRAATLSVREQDVNWLRLGLIGAALANFAIPPKREVEVSLAVFYHCARKLGRNPRILFDEAAEFGAEEIGARMRAFGRRDDVSLMRFGWREVRTTEGVQYKFEWR